MARNPGTPWTNENQGEKIKFADLRVCVGVESFGSSGSNATPPYQAALRTRVYRSPEDYKDVAQFKAQRDISVDNFRTYNYYSEGYWFRRSRCVSWRSTTVYIGGRYVNLQPFGVNGIQACMLGSPHLATRFTSSEPYDYFLVVYSCANLFSVGLGGPTITIFGIRASLSPELLNATLLTTDTFTLPRTDVVHYISGFTQVTNALCYYSPAETDGTGGFYFYIVTWDELFTTATTEALFYGELGEYHFVRTVSGPDIDTEETTTVTQSKAAPIFIKAGYDSFYFLGLRYTSYSVNKHTTGTAVITPPSASLALSASSNIETKVSIFKVTPTAVTLVVDAAFTDLSTSSVSANQEYVSGEIRDGDSVSTALTRYLEVLHFNGDTSELLFKLRTQTAEQSSTIAATGFIWSLESTLSESLDLNIYYQKGADTSLVTSDTFSTTHFFFQETPPFGLVDGPTGSAEDTTEPLFSVASDTKYISQGTAHTPKMILGCTYSVGLPTYTSGGAVIAFPAVQRVTVFVDKVTGTTSSIPVMIAELNPSAPLDYNRYSGVGVAQYRY